MREAEAGCELVAAEESENRRGKFSEGETIGIAHAVLIIIVYEWV